MPAIRRARSPRCAIGPSPALAGRPPRPRPASARSTTSSTSPTTCCSSSGTRCTRSTSSGSAAGELRARRARAGETIVTLDGEKRDARRRHARHRRRRSAAGGRRRDGRRGLRGLDAARALVAFESAYFKPASVRRTSKRLGLKTEASSRFERGADIDAPVVALERACALLEQIGAGRRVGAIVDCYPAPRGPAQVRLRRARIARLLGTDGRRRRGRAASSRASASTSSQSADGLGG